VGPLQYVISQRSSQEAAGRQRRCLLKECERFFRPQRPQSRFCSAACRLQARRWRRWRAGQRYRCSAGGKAKRRSQSQRYRQRLQEAAAANETAVNPTTAGEGQRPAFCGQKYCLHSCARPGCYVLFVVSQRSPCQKFCSVLCRQALRRVLDREKKWQRRRDERLRRRWQSPRSPPESSL
jgi:hypothetical protein